MESGVTSMHSLAAAALLALVHLLASKLRFLQVEPRSIWLSLGGGISVAYVFLHLLPELQEHQRAISGAAGGVLRDVEHHAYLVALLGLAVFYGLERLVLRDRRRQKRFSGADESSPGAFWISIGSFSVYNGLIGYLLLEQVRAGLSNLYIFTAAMGLHFVVNDYGLREHHRERYEQIGRWILSAAVLAGAAIGLRLEVPPLLVSVLVAFLAGGAILNVLKEELPSERESSFGAFAVGAALYAALLNRVG